MVASGGLYLGLESSCDDSAAAIVQVLPGQKAKVLSSVVIGQSVLHKEFGGVVPEVAARAHAERMDICVTDALAQAEKTLKDVDVIGVTSGPGLIGGVLSGVMSAKGLALGLGKPLIGVNHLVGHALTPRMTDQVGYPYLMLLASGGHCQFLIVKSAQEFHRLGGTIDDAPGEAFDKAAKMLGLDYPGGPRIAKLAEVARKEFGGTPYRFPRPMTDRPGLDFSFSGLKTFTLNTIQAIKRERELQVKDQAEIALAFEEAVVDTLRIKCRRALEQTGMKTIVIAGGVSANLHLRQTLEEMVVKFGAEVFYARPEFCTDNGAMIAYAGWQRLKSGQSSDEKFKVTPRWPMDTLNAI